MGGLQKSKRITWAPDVNLCQVKLFSYAKPPSEVGRGSQHRHQAKASWSAEPAMPPGFEKMANRIPLSRWRCPARIELNSKWQVVAGEESKEIKAMYQRERRVLEAVYPHPSAIPPNPRLPVNAQESIGDDHNIPLIPLIPIEESDPSYTGPMDIPQPQSGVVLSQSDGNSMVEAAKAALASVLSNTWNQDQRNLIDPELLIRILTNPNLLQQLLIATEQKPATQNVPNPKLQPKISSDSTSIPVSREAPVTKTELNAPPPTTTAAAPLHRPPFTKTELNAPPPTTTPFHQPPFTKTELNAPPTTTAAAPFHQPQRGTVFASTSVPSPPVVKDVNYYKSLIQQHGGGGGGGVLPHNCSQSNRLMGGTTQEFRKPGNSRMMKPCIYYNSNRGCKNGANCAYQHDIFSSQKRAFCATEVLAAKRIKLAR